MSERHSGNQAHWFKPSKARANVPVIPASEVEIIGPLVGVDVPDAGQCKWIEGEADTGRYCGQAAGRKPYCAYHAERVKADAATVKRVKNWNLKAG